jgi:hypothetical protein
MKTIILIIFFTPLILIMACKDSEDEKSQEGSCVDTAYQMLSYSKSQNTPPWVDLTYTTFMEDGNRIFQVETPVYGNVCPSKNVDVYIVTFVYKPYPTGSSFHVVFKYRYGTMMDYGNSEYVFSPDGGLPHEFDFSMQDAYPTGAGAFYIIIQYEMISPTSDPAADLAYFKEAFVSTSINLTYTKY